LLNIISSFYAYTEITVSQLRNKNFVFKVFGHSFLILDFIFKKPIKNAQE